MIARLRAEEQAIGGKGPELIAAFDQAYAAFTPNRDKMIVLAREGRGKDADDIHDDSGIDTAIEVLETLAVYHSDAAALAKTEARAAGERARLLVVGALAVAVVAGIAVALFISGGVVAGVRSVQTVLTSITENCAASLERGLGVMADNDLTVTVVSVTKPIAKYGSDEIGQTAAMTNLLLSRLQSTVEGYERARAGLREAVGLVQQAASGMAGTSSQLGAAAGQASGAVQQVTAAMQNVAAGSQEQTPSEPWLQIRAVSLAG